MWWANVYEDGSSGCDFHRDCHFRQPGTGSKRLPHDQMSQACFLQARRECDSCQNAFCTSCDSLHSSTEQHEQLIVFTKVSASFGEAREILSKSKEASTGGLQQTWGSFPAVFTVRRLGVSLGRRRRGAAALASLSLPDT